ncbi:MAG: T9SS type A sorting domain-containing protein [Ignavibacteriaceae bacterium]
MRTIIFAFWLLVFYSSFSNAQLVYWQNVWYQNNSNITDIKIASNGYLFACNESRILKSVDGGSTWSGISLHNTSKMVIDNQDNIYVAKGGSLTGVVKSTDYGLSWSDSYTGAVYATSMCLSKNGDIYIGDGSGDFIKSTDSGSSWIVVPITDKAITSIAVLDSGKIFVSTLGRSIFSSIDYGNSWTQILSPNLFYTIESMVADTNDYLYAEHSENISRSTDLGITWELVGFISSYPEEPVLSIDESNNLYYGYRGLYKSTNQGLSWSYLGGPSYVSCILTDSNRIFLGTYNSIYRYDPDITPYVGSNYLPLHIGNKWQFRGKDYSGYWLVTHEVTDDTLIGNLKYYKFLNNWVRYSEDDKKIYAWYNDTDYVHMDLTLIPQNSFVQYPLPYHNYSYFNIPNRIATFLHGNTTLFNMPLNYKGSGFDTTFIGATDYEENRYAENIGPYYYKFSNINLIRDHTIIMVIIYDSLGYQINYTNHYKPEISIIPITIINTESFDITVLVEHPYSVISKNFIFVDSVYVQSYYQNNDSIIYNQNKLAVRVTNSLNYRINTIVDTSLLKNGFDFYYRIVAKDKGIIQETTYSPDTGYYKCVWDFSTGLIEDLELNEFALMQNYPNPFNPSTNIRFQIPKYCLVTLKVFDVLGRQLEVLINEEKSPGIYQFSFDATGLANGTYFYQLIADDFMQVKKMQVMK